METLYRKVEVREPSQFEHNKLYYFVDFFGNIQTDRFFNCTSFDEYTDRYKYFLVEIPDPINQLQADKAELLEALNNIYIDIECFSDVESHGYGQEVESLIQKHKK